MNEGWKEFKESGMLWWVNRIIHTFGWSIVFYEEEDGTISKVVPERTRYLGFTKEIDEERFESFKNSIKEA